MNKIKLALKENSYDIHVGYKILEKLGTIIKPLNVGHDAVVITNPGILRRYKNSISSGLEREKFSAKFLVVPDGERSKSAEQAFKLLNQIAAYDVGRKIFILAFGGGVVGDLAGFVASVYKRGIPYIQIPTTLLAQIDSAIGGKVAIDLPVGKNLVGSFCQPRAVVSDVAVLSTLSERQIRNGLAEAIKYGVITDKNLFNYLEKDYKDILSLKPAALIKLVTVCSRIKADVVKRDEKETKGIRTILNFGHTLGHAIESAGRYNQYQHGEAIAIGIHAAALISVNLQLFSRVQLKRLKDLIQAVGLPLYFKKISTSDILKAMRHDKKFVAGKNRFVLARDIGKVQVVMDIPLKIIEAALKECEA